MNQPSQEQKDYVAALLTKNEPPSVAPRQRESPLSLDKRGHLARAAGPAEHTKYKHHSLIAYREGSWLLAGEKG